MTRPLDNIKTFEHLACLLLFRFIEFGAREDLDHGISYGRHLSNLPLEVVGVKHIDILKDLAHTLCSRFEVGGRPEDIEDDGNCKRVYTPYDDQVT
jgi:hypothetical protein